MKSGRSSPAAQIRVEDFVKANSESQRKDVAMRVLNNNVGRLDRRAKATCGTLLLIGALACGVALAQERRAGGPTPSGPGAEVYFIDLKDGATVPAKLKLYFGLRNMGVAPAGSDRENSGHHHLLIDTELPPLDQPIPNDFNHLHFGAGQTEAEVNLKQGEHTLQLLFGDKDHIPHTPPVMSPRIRVRVVDPSVRKPAPADARVYFVGIQDGSVLPQRATIRFGLTNMGVAPAGIDKPNT